MTRVDIPANSRFQAWWIFAEPLVSRVNPAEWEIWLGVGTGGDVWVNAAKLVEPKDPDVIGSVSLYDAPSGLIVVCRPVPPPPKPKEPCPGFQWIGQSFRHCDRCGEPAWTHRFVEALDRSKPLFAPDAFVYEYWPASTINAWVERKLITSEEADALRGRQ